MQENLNVELRQLIDKQSICELLYRYAEAIDRRDGELLSELFMPDCMLHYGGGFDEPAGVLIENWRTGNPSPFLITHHHVGNIQVNLGGEEEARAVTYFHALHKARRNTAIVDEMVRGRYLDRLAKSTGNWLFAERWIVYDWSRIAPSDESNWWDLMGSTALCGGHGREDPAFGFLSGERIP